MLGLVFRERLDELEVVLAERTLVIAAGGPGPVVDLMHWKSVSREHRP